MKNKILVRNGQHMRPMLEVLNRYDIGSIDEYGRGRWLHINDLQNLYSSMLQDRTVYKACVPEWVGVQGTNIHNMTRFGSFLSLFDGVDEIGCGYKEEPRHPWFVPEPRKEMI